MNSDIYRVLDELAARGRRLRGQLPGEHKPAGMDDPATGMLAKVHALNLHWPTVEQPNEGSGEGKTERAENEHARPGGTVG